MRTRYVFPTLLAAVALLAAAPGCSPEEDLQDKIVDGSPEILAEILPKDLFGPKQQAGMLPAHMTAAEITTQIKADGYDPRDQYADYAFTAVPGDVSHLPGEFESAQALLIGWPGGASNLTSFFAKIIKYAAPVIGTTVVYVNSNTLANQLYSAVSQIGGDLDNVYFVKMPLDTIWIRDYGPLVTKTTAGSFRIIDLRYYYGRWDDDVAPTRLANAWNVKVSRPPLEGEGGNFQSDGAGTCIVTDQMPYQNGYTSSQVRSVLKQYLGCQTTLVLPSLSGEGTGHVDMYVTITGPKQAIVGQYSTSDDPVNAKVVDKGAAMLVNAGFKVWRVPMPSNWDGAYRSYTNSLAVNNRVLVPVYSDDTRYESQALSVFKKAYPSHTIVPIDSTQIIQWAGAIHCVTMTLGS